MSVGIGIVWPSGCSVKGDPTRSDRCDAGGLSGREHSLGLFRVHWSWTRLVGCASSTSAIPSAMAS
jgi:hypothetical protein